VRWALFRRISLSFPPPTFSASMIHAMAQLAFDVGHTAFLPFQTALRPHFIRLGGVFSK